MDTRRWAVAAALAMGLSALGLAVPASANSGIETGPDTYTNVGAIGFSYDDGDGGTLYRYGCTGTLISADEFLTAHHCAEGLAVLQGMFDSDRLWVTFAHDLGALGNPADPFYTGMPVTLDGAVQYEVEGDAVLFPGFHAAANPAFNDLAIYQLGSSPADITPVRLPDAGFLPAQGDLGPKSTMTMVGYGTYYTWDTGRRDEPGNPKTWTFDGLRKAATVTFQGLTSTQLVNNTDKRADGAGGICAGDSGGPIFYGNTQVAIVIWGDRYCRSIGFNQRLDLPDVIAWMESLD